MIPLLAALVIVIGVRRSLRFRNHMAKSAMLD